MKDLNVSTGTIVRTILLALTAINSILAVFGLSPLPIDSAELEQTISWLLMAGSALWAWWKNNSFTPEAINADITMALDKAKK